jgi:hypothetical protein
VAVHGQAHLLDVVGTLHPAAGLPGRLHGRQEQADERRDDRDHHEKFDEREAAATAGA